MQLHRDPAAAFAVWQEARGAVVRAALPLPGAATAPLPHGTARISYFEMPAGVYIWVQSGTQLHGQFIPIADSALRGLSANLLERCSDPDTGGKAWHPLAARLYTLLIAPVEPWLGGAQHLVIEPDGPLKQLPFDLLMDAHGGLLGDRYSISFSPGADYLRAARPWKGVSASSRALVVGDASVRGWAPLPQVDTEVRAVAARFHRADLVTGTAPADFSSRLANTEVFHFSGHAEASPSSVALVQTGPDTALPLDFNALRRGSGQLVVLSACSTAQGATGLFDDADSPVQQLLAAHMPDVVASRWNVDSSATTQLMQAFYASLLQGAKPSEALRQAARTVRSQPLFAHPYYWASFAVYGEN
jgi:CHAT domain-containing protein